MENRMRKINDEVYYFNTDIVDLSASDVELLKRIAGGNQRKTARFCMHSDIEDGLHEMLIIHAKGNKVRPHKHLKKAESFHIVEGEMNVVLFNDNGEYVDTVELGDLHSRKLFYCRIPVGVYHSVVVITEVAVFHESTKGPFVKEETIFADWIYGNQ